MGFGKRVFSWHIVVFCLSLVKRKGGFFLSLFLPQCLKRGCVIIKQRSRVPKIVGRGYQVSKKPFWFLCWLLGVALRQRNRKETHLEYLCSVSKSSLDVAGLGSGSLSGNMNGVLGVFKGPFTDCQWAELQHQTLIYQLIRSDVQVPNNLLSSYNLNSNGVSASSPGSFRPSTMGWGPYNRGFFRNLNSEPGRCRRTDGKKWRCSKEAVVDQKYCERHINRGRQRSRKPVEGTGHCVRPRSLPLPLSSVVFASGSSYSPTIAQQQIGIWLPSISNSFPTQTDRELVGTKTSNYQVGGSHNLAIFLDLKLSESLFPIQNQANSFEGSSSQIDFGLTSDNAFLNLSSFTINNGSNPSLELQGQEILPQPLGHFSSDTWPHKSDSSSICRPGVSQPSNLIPMASDLSSLSSSPIKEKCTLSPLRLSLQFDPFHTGLGEGHLPDEMSRKPMSWGTSMGGPLGEALMATNNTRLALSPMTEVCNSSSLLHSSSTGVLPNTSTSLLFGRARNNPMEVNWTHSNISCLSDDPLGPNIVNCSSFPPL